MYDQSIDEMENEKQEQEEEEEEEEEPKQKQAPFFFLFHSEKKRRHDGVEDESINFLFFLSEHELIVIIFC